MSSKYIHVGDFCRVTADNLLVKDKVEKGDVVWVAGFKPVGMYEDDPYTQRILMLVHRVFGLHVEVGDGIYVMDPAGLAKLADDEQEPFKAQMEIDFPTKVEQIH